MTQAPPPPTPRPLRPLAACQGLAVPRAAGCESRVCVRPPDEVHEGVLCEELPALTRVSGTEASFRKHVGREAEDAEPCRSPAEGPVGGPTHVHSECPRGGCQLGLSPGPSSC